MPFIGGQEDVYDVAPRSQMNPGLNDYQAGAQSAVKQSHGLMATVAGDVGLGAVDLVDTVSSSIGLSGRGNITRGALTAVDMPGLNDFYNDNQGGVEVASGILGVVGSELIARKLTAPASIFMQGLRRIPYVRRIATLDAEYENAMRTVRNVDTALAARGAMGVEQYVGRVSADSLFDAGAHVTSQITQDVSRGRAVFRAKGIGALVGARNAAATEGVMALTLNQNGFLYDDDAGHNLAWMGLGLAGGAAVNWFHTAYQVRRFVNSDEIRRTFASALDPDKIEESRLLWHGRPLSEGAVPPGGFLGGTITDRVTSLNVNASLLRETPVSGTDDARALLAQRESLATQHLRLAREEIQKVTTRGISTNGYTRFSMDSRGFGNHLDMMMYRDPASMYGTEMIGGIGDDMTVAGVHNAHVVRLEERIKEVEEKLADPANEGVSDQLRGLRQRLDYERRLTPMAAIDGELMPMSEAQAIEGFVEPEIRFTPASRRGVKGEVKGIITKDSDKHGLWESITESPRGGVSIDSDLAIHIPGNKSLDNADHFDILRLYRTAQRAIEQMKSFTGPITLPKNPNWFQLDMAEEILRRSEGRANIIWPRGMNRDSAQVESLIQKAKGVQKWDAKETNQAMKADSKGQTYEGQLSKLRVRYNLPRLTAYERGVTGQIEHPVEQLLRGINTYGADEVRRMSLSDIKEAVARFKRLGDVAPVSAKDVESLSGNSFRYMLDESGNPVKPLIIYKRPFQQNEWTTDTIAERIAANKMTTVARLTEEQAAPMTRAISTRLVESPDFDAAARTHELMDNQIQGSLTGSAPQTALGSLGRSFTTSEWRDRDNPILLAATRIREAVNSQARDYMKLTIESAFGDILGRLENPRNAASKLLLSQFHSFRSGWDLARQPVQREGGFHAFTLSNTAANRERFRQMFGRGLAEGQTLLAPNGREVVLDDLALDAQTRFNAVTDVIRVEKNTLLRANGRGEISQVEWFTPPPNTNGKFIGFVIGPDGKTVPGMAVVADTQAEFTKARNALTPKLNELGMGYTFRTQDEIRNFATIWDQAQMDFIDPGTTAIQPSKKSRGALAGSQVKTDAFTESLQYTRDQFLRHANDITETLLKDQINAAKARANIASDVTRNRAGFYRDQQFRSVYDMYLENLLGTSKLNARGSLVGRIYNSIEGTLDKFLEEATPPLSRVWIATNEWINKATPWSRSEQARKDFDALTAKLGPYMPFESATQMLERRGAGVTPPTLARITGGINRFSAAMLLRMMEVAHPIMNLTGIVNALPSVIRHVQPFSGETTAEFAARIGHSTTIFELRDGSPIGVIDMSKIGARAFKRAWSREAEADYDYMVRHGFLSQEVAEFQRQYGAINSKNRLQTFLTGDPNSSSRFAQKGLVGWMSVLSDRSEDFSRSWGHMVGLELADTLGVTNMEARHAFAHDIANKMIANYSPHNRPEIFQGALGAPLGLFQSFILNYYQRIFRYIEVKDYRSLAMQYAMQSALFGVTGVPGWKQFSGLLTDEHGDNLTSGLYHRFPGTLGSILGGGVVSNVPRIFGGEAVDLYSRGDINARVPGIPTGTGSVLDSIPGTAVLRKLYQGIAEGISAFADRRTVSKTQLAEIASNMIANRPMAGMIEQFFAHGNDTDRYGQLVSDTRGAMEAAYRLIGLRSMRQSREVQAFYANRNAQSLKAAQDEGLRLATRAMIRQGNFDGLPDVFQKYVENGGDPRNFRRWIKENYESAMSTRGERQLEAALRNPQRMGEVVRLLDAGVSIDADEATPDPAETYGPGNGGDELNQDTLELGNYSNQQTLLPTSPDRQ